jgi:hypothetical protein
MSKEINNVNTNNLNYTIMKRNNFYIMMIMVAMMCMASVNANAQGRRGGDRHGYRIEMNGPARHHDMNRHHDMGRHHEMRHPRGVVAHHNVVVEHHPARHIYIGGRYFDPRWEGRIRYERGRWGYLRGTDWYWYDRYYEPDFYYGHPVAHFHHCHVSPAAAVAGAVGAVALGALVAALSY